MRLFAGLALTFLCLSTVRAVPADPTVTLAFVTTYVSPTGPGTEILSVQAATRRAVLCNSVTGQVELLDLADPAAPASFAVFSLGLAPGEEATSVAFHPEADYFAVTIIAAGAADPGRVELRRASTGLLLQALPAGVGPDSVVIDPTGRRAVVADEAERFVFSAGVFSSPAGSVTVLDLRNGPGAATAVTIPLPDLSGVPGFTAPADQRFVERAVDWNGNGVIDRPVNLNGDSDTTDTNVLVGTFHGVEVRAREADGETFLIPVTGATPDLLEPEGVAISKEGKTAYVTLQESNGVIVIDIAAAAILGAFGLGTTTHLADLTNNSPPLVQFTQTLFALREPDGIALTRGGDYFVTADEGDTDPRADRVAAGKPAGGGRTLSVFRASTGQFVGDTGNGIDAAAAQAGIYPDGRSRNKGSEPEGVLTLKIGPADYAVVSLERANGLALVSLADPAHPTVLSAVGGGSAPEGLASLKVEEEDATYIYTANEVGGGVSVFRATK
jgi:DNA-binding beta-propeller fold protein YncE